MLMRGSEVDVIIEDGSLLVGILQEALHLWTDNGIQGIKRTKEYQIVSMNLWEREVKTIAKMVLIEDIFGIIALVEERQ